MAKQQIYKDPSRQSPVPQAPEQSEALHQDASRDVPVEEDASRSAADFVQNVRPLQERKQKTRKRRMVFAFLALALLIGGAGYALFAYSQRNTESEQPQKADQPKKQSQAETDASGRYSSTNLNLSFDRPDNWELDDSEDSLKLSSPVTTFTDATGQQVEAKVILNIVPTAADSDFPKDQATAVRESIKFTYDAPAEGQRQETFLSFMNLDGPSEGLNAIYVTGDKSYVKGDPVTKADFDAVEPIVWLEFYACPAGTCSDTEKLTIAPEAWDSDAMLKTAFLTLKSLNIK